VVRGGNGVRILKNQRVAGRKPKGDDPGEEKTEFFKPAAEARVLRVWQIKD
jgi:hypothetical protein